MSFDIAHLVKKFAPSFTHAPGHLDRRIDCPRHFAGFGLRRLLRASDCPHAYRYGERLRPWLSCLTRRCDGRFQSAVARRAVRMFSYLMPVILILYAASAEKRSRQLFDYRHRRSFNNAAPLAARSDERAVHISARGDKPYAPGVVRC